MNHKFGLVGNFDGDVSVNFLEVPNLWGLLLFLRSDWGNSSFFGRNSGFFCEPISLQFFPFWQLRFA
jgi:hypothetical protein